MPIADEIRTRRKAHHLTQEELARAAKTTRSHIGLIEIGQRRPSLDLLERLAVVLDTTVSRLLR